MHASGSHVVLPRILSASRGTAVMGDGKEDGESVAGVHRPWKDVIAVLVDPKLTDILIAGVGIGATWVELVHAHAEGSYAASNKGKGVNKEVPKYWYMEQPVNQLPIFHSL